MNFFLSHLAYGVELVPGFVKLTIFSVNQDGTVHLMQSLFSVSVGLYSTTRRLFACPGYLPVYGLPLLVEIPVEDFTVRCSVRTVPRADHMSRFEGGTLPVWKSMPCDRVGNIHME